MRKYSHALSPCELAVWKLIAYGHSNKMMADQLGSARKTIEKHRQALYNKLKLHTTAEACRYYWKLHPTEL